MMIHFRYNHMFKSIYNQGEGEREKGRGKGKKEKKKEIKTKQAKWTINRMRTLV